MRTDRGRKPEATATEGPQVRLSVFSDDEVQRVQKFVEDMTQLQLPEFETVVPHLEKVTADPGATIFSQGEPYPYIALQMKGHVALSSHLDDGQEWLISISSPGHILGSIAALRPEKMGVLLSMQPSYPIIVSEFEAGVSTYTAKALTPSVSLRLEFVVLEQLANRHPEWAMVLLRQLYLYAAQKEMRHREFLMCTPMERYQRFMADRGYLAELLPKRSIASLLGITPESLSRILSRLRRRES